MWDYENAEELEGRWKDITWSLKQAKGADAVDCWLFAEIKNPIAHWVVIGNLIRFLKRGEERLKVYLFDRYK